MHCSRRQRASGARRVLEKGLFCCKRNLKHVQPIIRVGVLASALVPFDALISWLRLQMDFAARGRSMGAAIMAAKHVPGTRISDANKAMHEAGEVLLLRAQAAEQIRTDVHILDVIRLVYGIALVNEHASDPDGANRMLDLVIAGIRTKPSRD